ALPLVLVALSYLAYQGLRQPGPRELLKAALLAAAFMFWAANQLMPQSRVATLLNDVAIVLFALDVFLVMVGWPRAKHIRHVRGIPEGSMPYAPKEAEACASPTPLAGRSGTCGSPSRTVATSAACTACPRRSSGRATSSSSWRTSSTTRRSPAWQRSSSTWECARSA